MLTKGPRPDHTCLPRVLKDSLLSTPELGVLSRPRSVGGRPLASRSPRGLGADRVVLVRHRQQRAAKLLTGCG